jgi:hypothetical protein
LVFTSFLIGWPLRLLYTFCKGCNWYLLYLIAVQYAAMTALGFLVFSRRRLWSSLWIYVGFFCLVQIRMMVNLQFTTTAFLAGTAGLMLIVEGLSNGKIRRKVTVCGLILLTLAAMIREQVVPLLVAVAAPFLLERIRVMNWRRFIVGAGIALTTVVLLVTLNRWYYHLDRDWSEFAAYNRVRGQIHETPLTNGLPQAVSNIGWSKNDGELFRRFYYSEPDVYASTAKMRILLRQLQQLRLRDLPLIQKELLRCYFVPDGFPRDSALFMKLALLSGALFLLAIPIHRGTRFVVLVATYFIFVVLSVYLRTTARLPERVAFTMPLFMTTLYLYWLSDSSSLPSKPLLRRALNLALPTFSRLTLNPQLKWTAALGCGALFVPYFFHFNEGWWYENSFNRQVRAASSSIFQPLVFLGKSNPKQVLIVMPQESALDYCLTFLPPSTFFPFKLIPFGWPTHSPIFKRAIEQEHLRPYSTSLLERRDVLFLMSDQWKVPLQTFYQEHYQREIGFDLVLSIDRIPKYPGHALQFYRAHTLSLLTQTNTVSGKIPQLHPSPSSSSFALFSGPQTTEQETH